MKKNLFYILLLPVFLASCATPSGRLKYIELHSRECYICNRMGPVIEAASAKYSGVVDVESFSTSMDTGEELVKKYNIKKFPGNLFLDADGMIFFRHEGLLDIKSVEEVLDRKIKALGISRTAK